MATSSYHGDPAVKARHIAMAERHRDQDMLIKGTYGQQNGHFRGCSVGCFAFDISGRRQGFSTAHETVAADAGWPLWLVRLSDTLFEGLPSERRNDFHVELRRAVPVGKDIEPIRFCFALALLTENAERVKHLSINEELKKQVLDAIEQVVAVNRAALETGVWNDVAAFSAACSAYSAARSARSARSAAFSAAYSAAYSAYSAAYSAAFSAADSAAYSADSAAYSADSAADSADSAARSAAFSAADSAAYSADSAAYSADSAADSADSAARSAAYIRYADELLRLLQAA